MPFYLYFILIIYGLQWMGCTSKRESVFSGKNTSEWIDFCAKPVNTLQTVDSIWNQCQIADTLWQDHHSFFQVGHLFSQKSVHLIAQTKNAGTQIGIHVYRKRGRQWVEILKTEAASFDTTFIGTVKDFNFDAIADLYLAGQVTNGRCFGSTCGELYCYDPLKDSLKKMESFFEILNPIVDTKTKHIYSFSDCVNRYAKYNWNKNQLVLDEMIQMDLVTDIDSVHVEHQFFKKDSKNPIKSVKYKQKTSVLPDEWEDKRKLR